MKIKNVKKKLVMWIYNPKKEKLQFDPYKSTLTRVIVNCNFTRLINDVVEYTYIHPRLNKKLNGKISKELWNE